jgi:hypothetical protein
MWRARGSRPTLKAISFAWFSVLLMRAKDVYLQFAVHPLVMGACQIYGKLWGLKKVQSEGMFRHEWSGWMSKSSLAKR